LQLSEDRDQQLFKKRSGVTETKQVENDQFGNMQPKRPNPPPEINGSQQMVVHVESLADSQSFSRAEGASKQYAPVVYLSVVLIRCLFLVPSLAAKKAFQATETQCLVDDDHDENKYKRRSAIQWCLRWWK